MIIDNFSKKLDKIKERYIKNLEYELQLKRYFVKITIDCPINGKIVVCYDEYIGYDKADVYFKALNECVNINYRGNIYHYIKLLEGKTKFHSAEVI